MALQVNAKKTMSEEKNHKKCEQIQEETLQTGSLQEEELEVHYGIILRWVIMYSTGLFLNFVFSFVYSSVCEGTAEGGGASTHRVPEVSAGPEPGQSRLHHALMLAPVTGNGFLDWSKEMDLFVQNLTNECH